MNFNIGGATTGAGSTFGTTTSSTGFSFGSGDASKPLFGATNTQDNKPGGFNFTSPNAGAQAQPFGGSAFGAKTTAATSSLFSSPTSTPAFGAAKPQGFGAPPNQTVGSPGFGQAAQAQSTPFSLTSQAAPASGTQQTTQAAPAFGTPASTGGFGGFGKPAQPSAGFSFTTPASGFSATSTAATTSQAAPPAFGAAFGSKPSTFSMGAAPATTAAPTFGSPAQPTVQPAPNLSFGANTSVGFGSQPAQSGLSFGSPAGTTTAATTQATTLSFGQPASQPNQPGKPGFGAQAPLSFGQPTTQANLSFGATTQPAGLSFGTATTSSTGVTFGDASSTPSSTPATSLSFGATTAATSVGFGTPTASTASKPVLSFGTPASTAAPTTGLNFGTPSTAAPTTGLSFGTTTSAPTGLSFGTTSAPTSLSFGTTAASTAATGLGFGTTTTTGLSFGAKIATSAAPTSSAPSGITALGKSTAAATMPTLTSTTTTTAAPLVPPQAITSITFAELEENINKWTLDLEEQEKTFINQATQINAWDRLLIANGEKIVELNEVVQTVKNEQQSLEHELDFVLAQQKELEDLLTPLEKNVLENAGDRVRDPEREQMYTLAESLDSQLKQMSEDLKEVIEHLNETNRGQDSNDPIVQIGRILNTHMSSMQWIDNSIRQISDKLDQLKATHDTLRLENERSFQLTYN